MKQVSSCLLSLLGGIIFSALVYAVAFIILQVVACILKGAK